MQAQTGPPLTPALSPRRGRIFDSDGREFVCGCAGLAGRIKARWGVRVFGPAERRFGCPFAYMALERFFFLREVRAPHGARTSHSSVANDNFACVFVNIRRRFDKSTAGEFSAIVMELRFCSR